MKKKSNLFDVVKWMFEDPAKFKSIPDAELANHFFMINRFMAIKFPVQSQYINVVGINTAEMLKFWHHTVRKRLNRTPGWIFTKSTKPKKKNSKAEYSDEAKRWYMTQFRLSHKDFNELFKYDSERMTSSLKELDKKMETVNNG